MAYTKLFNSIVTSTIWSEDDKTRIVWITMLALADKNGEVQGSIPGLARIAGVPIDDCRASICKFLSPDPDSRTKDDEGKRIEEIDGGWVLLNHSKYRGMASDDDRRNQAAIRQQRVRDRKARQSVTPESRDSHATVTPESRQIPQAEAEANTEAEELKDKVVEIAAIASEVVEFWNSRNELAKIRSVTPNRKKAIKARMSEPFFAENWKAAIHKLLESPFLTGTNDRGWRADFDWFLKPDSVPRIMEGKYDFTAPVKTYSHANGYNESTSIDHL